MNFQFSIVPHTYHDTIWKELFYKQELYWLVFHSMLDWNFPDRLRAMEWFCDNIPIGADNLLHGFMNFNWWKRLIAIIIGDINYRRLNSMGEHRIHILSSVFEVFARKHVYLNLEVCDIDDWMVGMAELIIQCDMKCQSLNAMEHQFERQLLTARRKYTINTEFQEIFANLFARVYFYGRQSAIAKGEQFLDSFENEVFFEHVFINNFGGRGNIEIEFAEFCVEVYAGAYFVDH